MVINSGDIVKKVEGALFPNKLFKVIKVHDSTIIVQALEGQYGVDNLKHTFDTFKFIKVRSVKKREVISWL